MSSPPPPSTGIEDDQRRNDIDHPTPSQALPPQYPESEASSSRPPPFSSLYHNPPVATPSGSQHSGSSYSSASVPFDRVSVAHSAPSYNTLTLPPSATRAVRQHLGASEQTDPTVKREAPETKKTPSKEEELEPPPAYSEGPSPLHSFTYVMATAGGASSIITQVQQGGPPTNTLGGEDITSPCYYCGS